MQNVDKRRLCTCATHTDTGAATSYQTSVILPLIRVHIKARSMPAEQCRLITGSCKGFWSLSMAFGPHSHSRGSCDQGHARPDRHGDEAYDYKHSAGICSPWLIGLGAARLQCFPAEEASVSLRLMFCGVYTSKAKPSLFHSCTLFYGAFKTGFITSDGIAAFSVTALDWARIWWYGRVESYIVMFPSHWLTVLQQVEYILWVWFEHY